MRLPNPTAKQSDLFSIVCKDDDVLSATASPFVRTGSDTTFGTVHDTVMAAVVARDQCVCVVEFACCETRYTVVCKDDDVLSATASPFVHAGYDTTFGTVHNTVMAVVVARDQCVCGR